MRRTGDVRGTDADGDRVQRAASLTSSRSSGARSTPPPGDSIVYVVTAPGGRQTTTAAASYDLPVATLPTGSTRCQAQVSSSWRSSPPTITVSLTALGLLYLCSTP